MLNFKAFTFNAYQENTYVIFNDQKECAIIDPGCYSKTEQEQLLSYIQENELIPRYLLNTHGHIDHMLGNRYVKDTFDIPFLTHELVINELEATKAYGAMFGFSPAPSPPPDKLVDEGDVIALGDEEIKVIFTPGHSAGHISFYHEASAQLFSGDVLFQGSIGRTDLPGGDYPTLMRTIFQKLIPLGSEVIVYPGHGPSTTIEQEIASNPFVRQHWLEFFPEA
ncbi:MAG: MBL fold metallo-hydrolase [Bacteroidota bacterium]